MESRSIIGVRIDATNYDEASAKIVDWASTGASRQVCVCNVHMVMEAHDDPAFRAIVNSSDMVTPDGVPLVWALRRLGVPHATRVYGPDLMLAVLERASREGVAVGFHGGDAATLSALRTRVKQRLPGLDLVYIHAPPFGPPVLRPDDVEAIRRAGVRILFVALGCPKQERWMALHRGHVPCVMLGVGAAFDFVAGNKRQAPQLLQRAGLEWAFRLLNEPRRLWRRYAIHNPRFVILLLRQLLDRRQDSIE